jgi:subtilisin
MPFRNPPYRVEQVYSASDVREVVDWGLTLFGVPEVWKTTKGKGADGKSKVAAILDTGVQMSHPDLKGQIIEAEDFTGSPHGVDDRQGHGTHCAGIVLAEENNVGCIGVAPQAKAIIGKVLGDDGSGSGRNIARGIRWAWQFRPDVISMSLGSPYNDQDIAQAILDCVMEDAIFVVAAGNSGQNTAHIDYPGALPTVLPVAAVDRYGRVAQFSSSGPEVCVAAPGEDVLSCFPPSGYAKLSGTSMATPFVAGILLLAMAAGARFNGIEELKSIIKQTAKDVGKPGRDNSYGWGLINPGGMLPPPPPPVGEIDRVLAENCTIDDVAGALIFRRKE